MNTLQPNLNTTPISPAAMSIPSFQAAPLPSELSAQPSFTQALASANSNSNQVPANQNSQNTPTSASSSSSASSAPNAPSAPNVPSAQNNQSTDTAQSTQDAQNSQASASSTAAPATGKTADKTADKTKTDKQTADASAADKSSSDLLALVAASQAGADSKVTPQQQAAATQALPVAVPLTAQLVSTGGKGGGKGSNANGAIDVNGKAANTSLPDAWNAKAGADGKQTPTTDSITPADTNAANNPAALGQTATKDVAAGKADAAAAQAVAGANAAPAALTAKAGPDLQTLSTGATAASNNNAMFNPALQQVASTSPQSAAAAGDKLTPTVGTTDWNSALGQKVVWMSNNGQQSATLTLNPRDLGPMQVTINVTKNQADATFVAANPEVKQALEAAMPKLREMMDQAGIQLGQANVSTGMPNQNQQAFNQPQSSNNNGSRTANGGNSGGQSGGDIALSSVAIAPASGGSSGQGLVDTFV